MKHRYGHRKPATSYIRTTTNKNARAHSAATSTGSAKTSTALMWAKGHPLGQCHSVKPEAWDGEKKANPHHQELLSPTTQKQ